MLTKIPNQRNRRRFPTEERWATNADSRNHIAPASSRSVTQHITPAGGTVNCWFSLQKTSMEALTPD